MTAIRDRLYFSHRFIFWSIVAVVLVVAVALALVLAYFVTPYMLLIIPIVIPAIIYKARKKYVDLGYDNKSYSGQLNVALCNTTAPQLDNIIPANLLRNTTAPQPDNIIPANFVINKVNYPINIKLSNSILEKNIDLTVKDLKKAIVQSLLDDGMLHDEYHNLEISITLSQNNTLIFEKSMDSSYFEKTSNSTLTGNDIVYTKKKLHNPDATRSSNQYNIKLELPTHERICTPHERICTPLEEKIKAIQENATAIFEQVRTLSTNAVPQNTRNKAELLTKSNGGSVVCIIPTGRFSVLHSNMEQINKKLEKLFSLNLKDTEQNSQNDLSCIFTLYENCVHVLDNMERKDLHALTPSETQPQFTYIRNEIANQKDALNDLRGNLTTLTAQFNGNCAPSPTAYEALQTWASSKKQLELFCKSTKQELPAPEGSVATNC